MNYYVNEKHEWEQRKVYGNHGWRSWCLNWPLHYCSIQLLDNPVDKLDFTIDFLIKVRRDTRERHTVRSVQTYQMKFESTIKEMQLTEQYGEGFIGKKSEHQSASRKLNYRLPAGSPDQVPPDAATIKNIASYSVYDFANR